MAKILRKYQKIFGGSSAAAPSGIFAKFGSLAAASPAYSSDPAVIQALADQLSPLVGNNTSSPRAWVNFDGTQIPGNGGGSLTIRSSYGVSAVNKIAGSAAQYEVVFAGAFPDTTYAQFIQCGVAYNTLADYGRLSLKQNGSMRFKSLTTSSAEGQSSDCNVSIFSVNPLV